MLSKRIIKENKEALERVSRYLELPLNSLEDIVNIPQVEKERFNTVMESLVKKFKPVQLRDLDKYTEIISILNLLDVAHSWVTGLHFYVDRKKLPIYNTTESSLDVFKDFPMDDIVVDFNGGICAVRFSKNRYKVQMGKDLYNVWTVAVTTLAEKNSCKTAEYYFIPEKFPRLFVDSSDTCTLCKKCKCGNYKIFESGSESEAKWVLCRSSMRKEALCKLDLSCMYESQGCGTSAFLDMDSLIYYCAYCLNAYVNRNKNKKNRLPSEGIKLSAPRKMQEPSKKPFEDRFVSLSEYSSYERKERKEWQGGHHASPRTHQRSGYFRHYKSGKVIWVEPTIINKNKGVSTIYTVK